jgi:hypothetical protein
MEMEKAAFCYPRGVLDNLITEKALAVVNRSGNANLLDSFLADQVEEALPIKNVCAKVAGELSDQIDEVVGLLGISKRRFLEAAFIEAVSRAQAIMEREGVYHSMEDHE